MNMAQSWLPSAHATCAFLPVLEQDRQRHEVRFQGRAAETAMFFVSTLEGAMLVARANGRMAQFDAVAAQLLDRVRVVQGTAR